MDWCKIEKYIEFSKGYWNVLVPKEGITICPACNEGILVDSILTHREFNIIEEISDSDRQFLEAMIQLKQNDIIEYQSRMSQFKTQLQQQKQTQQAVQNSNTPRCPVCSSPDIKKISGLSKAGSVAIWGIFSRKVHKQWHCNNCGSEF